MADDGELGGFGWGFLVGAALGLVAGAYLATGVSRDQVESLRVRTIELTGSARRAASDPDSPVRRAIQDGINAARRRRQELDAEAAREEGAVVERPETTGA
jgi:hypothetical protein